MTSSQSFSFRGATARVNAHEEDRRLARVVAGNLQKPTQQSGRSNRILERLTVLAGEDFTVACHGVSCRPVGCARSWCLPHRNSR
jgi:hypothetical protein